MLKLIKLEWKKGNIVRHLYCVVIMTVVLLIFLIATAGTAGADTTSMGLYERSIINAAVELYTNMAFMVFTGIMLASFIVGEYESGTICLMFSYPIKRKKILLSKIFAVWIFSFSALILSKLFIYAVLLASRSLIDISAEDIPFSSIMFWLDMLLSSVVMISISYIALLIGLKMNSSKSTVVAAMLIALFSHGDIRGYTLLDNIPIYVTLLIISVISVCFTLHKLDTKDVL